MTTTVLTNAVWLHHGSDLTGVANQITLDYSAESLDDTVFGMKARSNKGGLFVLQFSGGGLVDYDEEDANTFARVGDNSIEGVLQMSEQPDDGSIGYAFKALANQYTWGAQVGELLPFTADGQGKSGAPLVRGTILHPKADSVTNTRNGTGRQLGAVDTNDKVYGALNVVEAAGTTNTLVVTVESDNTNGFTSPTTVLTFSTASAPTSQWSSTNGPLSDDWWRVTATVGGATADFNFQLLLAIQ